MSRHAEPRIDIILTCYNEGPYVGHAVRSVLDQTLSSRIERIVIADDGSDERTRAVLRKIAGWDPRIRVLFGAGGVGLPGQRNNCLAVTSAPYVAILDGDDYWTPDKLERQLPHLDRDDEIGLVYSDFYAFADGGITFARRAGVRDATKAGHLARTIFLEDPPIVPSTTILRRAPLEDVGLFDPDIRLFEDTDLWLRMSRVCRFGFVDAPLVYKRYRAQSLTGGSHDPMIDHATIALKAACHAPDLLPYIPRRLAERARKLGNHRFLQGDADEAARLIRVALRLYPLNGRAWTSWLAICVAPRTAQSLLSRIIRKRQRAIGALR